MSNSTPTPASGAPLASGESFRPDELVVLTVFGYASPSRVVSGPDAYGEYVVESLRYKGSRILAPASLLSKGE